MYDTDGFRVPNQLNRFSLGDRDKFKFNADGSLTIYIQHDSPGARSGIELTAGLTPVRLGERELAPSPTKAKGLRADSSLVK